MLTRLVEISYPALCPEVRRRFGDLESLREVSDHRSDFLRKAAEDAGMELPACLT